LPPSSPSPSIRRLPGCSGGCSAAGGRRPALATFLVFLVVLLALAGLVTAFVVPLVQQATRFAGQLPELIDQARAGQGPVGRLLERTNVLQWVQDNQDRIDSFVSGLTAPAAGVLRSVVTVIAGAITVFVLAYLMVLEGPKVVDGATNVFASATGGADPSGRCRLRQVGDRGTSPATC
jgi:predicted PurR-regulated permease PerM